MSIIKQLIISLVTPVLMLASFSSQAILLTIDPGTPVTGLPPDPHQPGDGSYIFCECQPDLFLPGELTPGPDGGIIIGQTQSASGSHTGYPDGSEQASIDDPWYFFGNTGMHFTEEPITVISITGNTMLLDFSGWRWEWNGVVSDLSGAGSGVDPWGRPYTDTGIAEVICSIDGCPVGSDYSLAYSYHIPLDDVSGFAGAPFSLILEGTISAVPVPAAIWLYVSGLLGLVAVSKKVT